MPRTSVMRSAPVARKWPLHIALAVLVAAAGAGAWGVVGGTPPAPSPTAAQVVAPAAAQSSGSGPSPMPAGTYRYRALGHSMVSTSGVKETTGEGSIVVEPAQGDRQHIVQRHPGLVIDSIVSYRPEGIFLMEMRIEHEAFTKQFRSVAGAPILPADAAHAARWEWRMTSDDGSTALAAAFSWFRAENVKVGSKSVPTVAFRVTMTIADKDMRATIAQTLWQATDNGRLVELREDVDGAVGTTRFRYDRRFVLEEADPS